MWQRMAGACGWLLAGACGLGCTWLDGAPTTPCPPRCTAPHLDPHLHALAAAPHANGFIQAG